MFEQVLAVYRPCRMFHHHEVDVGRAVRGREGRSQDIGRERREPGDRLQSAGQPVPRFPLCLLRYDAAEKGLLVEAAGHPLHIEFEVLDQLAASGPLEDVRGIQRVSRIAFLQVLQDHLGFGEAAVIGLEEWNLAERRGMQERLAFPRIDQPLPKGDVLLAQDEFELVVIVADAKPAQGDHDRASAPCTGAAGLTRRRWSAAAQGAE